VSAFEPISLDRGRQAAPQVFEQLREMIVNLDFPPGITLIRTELMARFGVSQTPIRDALMRLAEEGLVDVFPQNATLVSRIDIAMAEQAHFLRRSVELEIVEKLARRPERDFIQTMLVFLARQRAALEQGDLAQFTANDGLFHRSMYEAAGVAGLWSLIRSRSGHIDRLRRLHLPDEGKAKAILSDHQDIVDAIARGRVQLAREALQHHLSGTLAHIEIIQERFPEYMK
jgi:DNA-binding GntR family transcriptional regulator